VADGLIALGKLCLAVALGVLLLAYLLQDRLIFHPQRSGASPAGAQSVFIQAHDGTRLHAWHVPGSPLVLYFGGNAEEVSWMAREVRRQAPGTGWLLVDYRGYGASEGSPSEKSLVKDGLSWYDHAARSSKSIYLFGRSLGSGVAVQLATQRSVDGVILVAPFDSLVEVGRHHYPILPVGWMLRHRFDSLGAAPAVKAPLLCLVAGRDEIIPAAGSRRLYEAWGGKKRWLELVGAGHNSTDGAPQFWSAIRGFLDPKNGKPA
jgi:uncharacterized protein